MRSVDSPMAPPPIILKPITTERLADLQEMYEASDQYFHTFTGDKVLPIQAANDYAQLIESDDRAIMAIWWKEESIIGSLDFRFNHPDENVLWLGAMILRDELPGDRPAIAEWSIKILMEWLRIATDIEEIRTAVPLTAPELVYFWKQMDFILTPELLRQKIANKSIRFGVYTKTIDHSSRQT